MGRGCEVDCSGEGGRGEGDGGREEGDGGRGEGEGVRGEGEGVHEGDDCHDGGEGREREQLLCLATQRTRSLVQ